MTRTRVAIIGRPTMLTEALDIVLTIDGYLVRHHHTHYVPSAAVALVDLDQTPIRRLRAVATRVPVAALATAPTDADRGQALLDGARVVLDKGEALRSVVSVVRRLSGGLAVLDHGEWQRLTAAATPSPAEHASLDGLTSAERAVLDLLARGLTVPQIAAARVVSERTVRHQIKVILAKLGVTRQHAAVGIYLRAQMEAAA